MEIEKKWHTMYITYLHSQAISPTAKIYLRTLIQGLWGVIIYFQIFDRRRCLCVLKNNMSLMRYFRCDWTTCFCNEWWGISKYNVGDLKKRSFCCELFNLKKGHYMHALLINIKRLSFFGNVSNVLTLYSSHKAVNSTSFYMWSVYNANAANLIA